MFVASEAKFDVARRHCQENYGGDLVVIDSQQKKNFIEDFVATLHNNRFWIGLRDVGLNDTNAGHIWLPTGRSLAASNYIHWDAYNPVAIHKECVFADAERDVKWRDKKCSNYLDYICETSKVLMLYDLIK